MTTRAYRLIRFCHIPSFCVVLACAWATSVQAQCNANDITTADGYVVREVRLETLFGRAPAELEKAFSKHRGDKYIDEDSRTRLQYIEEVKDFFSERNGAVSEDRRTGINQQNSFYVKATYISDCVRKVPEPECRRTATDKQGQPVDKCLDITLKIKVIPIHTDSLSANLLDLARSNRMRFYRELPKGVRIFNPVFWVDYDRDNGPTAVVNSTIDLMELATVSGEGDTTGNTQLHLAITGRKSLQKRLYDTAAMFSVTRKGPLDLFSSFGLNASFLAKEEPQGDGRKLINSFCMGVNAKLNIQRGPLTTVRLDANYRRSSNRFFGGVGTLSEQNKENAIELASIVEGSIARGFLRSGLWFDAAKTTSGQDSYHRLATLAGYAREIVLSKSTCRIVKTQDESELCEFPSKNSPSIGLEMLFGAGHAWGSVPQYARFFGGNSAGNFLYDALNRATPITMPNGPLIRSFGVNNAGVHNASSNRTFGGTSYWHYNLSIAVPLGTLSRPLIPAVTVSALPDDSGHLTCDSCTSLKQTLKNQVAGEKNIFIDAMAVRKMTAEQREDLALEPDDPNNPLTDDERVRLAAAEKVFENKRHEVQKSADKIWERLTPTIDYLADHANLYSVRPLLMFDAARVTDGVIPAQRTRMAVGGGIQFTVVVAKFEIGYARTVRALPGDEKGNFVVRMLFEKLF